MEKERRPHRGTARFLGVSLGVFLSLALLVSAFAEILTSESFYQGQDDRYHLTEALSLRSFDEYRKLYTAVTKTLDGKPSAETVQKQGRPEDFEDTFRTFPGTVLISRDGQAVGTVAGTARFSEKMLNTAKTLNKGKADCRLDVTLQLPAGGFQTEEKPVLGIREIVLTDGAGSPIAYSLKGAATNGAKEKDLALGEGLKLTNGTGHVILSFEPAEEIVFSLAAFCENAEGTPVASVRLLVGQTTATAAQAADKIGGEVLPALTERESASLARFRKNLMTVSLALWAAAALAAAGVIVLIVRHKRQYMKTMGICLCVTTLVLALASMLVWHRLGGGPAIGLLFPESPDGLMSGIFTENLGKDLMTGLGRFHVFLSLIPLFLSYLLVHFSTGKKEHENDSYLYQ